MLEPPTSWRQVMLAPDDDRQSMGAEAEERAAEFSVAADVAEVWVRPELGMVLEAELSVLTSSLEAWRSEVSAEAWCSELQVQSAWRHRDRRERSYPYVAPQCLREARLHAESVRELGTCCGWSQYQDQQRDEDDWEPKMLHVYSSLL